VNGGTGKHSSWETFKQFEGMSEEEIRKISIKEYEKYEMERMEKNAWHVAKEITKRIDEAPVLSTNIKAYLSEFNEKQFFFNGDNLRAYQAASSKKKVKYQVQPTYKRFSLLWTSITTMVHYIWST
jgi:hypothetical protein